MLKLKNVNVQIGSEFLLLENKSNLSFSYSNFKNSKVDFLFFLGRKPFSRKLSFLSLPLLAEQKEKSYLFPHSDVWTLEEVLYKKYRAKFLFLLRLTYSNNNFYNQRSIFSRNIVRK